MRSTSGSRVCTATRAPSRHVVRRCAAIVLGGLVLTGCSLEQDVTSNPESGPRVGTLAPVLSSTTLDGARFDLAAQRGHVVIIDFFASWCGPCRAQQPELNTLASRYASRGVVVVGVDFREGEAESRSYLRGNAVPYPGVRDPDGSVAAAFAVAAPPTTVIIDAAGKVAASYFGGVRAGDLGPVIDRLLGSASTT
jgi:thiol-disulfide isomerase/thioredoxin